MVSGSRCEGCGSFLFHVKRGAAKGGAGASSRPPRESPMEEQSPRARHGGSASASQRSRSPRWSGSNASPRAHLVRAQSDVLETAHQYLEGHRVSGWRSCSAKAMAHMPPTRRPLDLGRVSLLLGLVAAGLACVRHLRRPGWSNWRRRRPAKGAESTASAWTRSEHLRLGKPADLAGQVRSP